MIEKDADIRHGLCKPWLQTTSLSRHYNGHNNVDKGDLQFQNYYIYLFLTRSPKLYSVRDLAIDMEIALFPGQHLLWFLVLLLLSLQHNRTKSEYV